MSKEIAMLINKLSNIKLAGTTETNTLLQLSSDIDMLIDAYSKREPQYKHILDDKN